MNLGEMKSLNHHVPILHNKNNEIGTIPTSLYGLWKVGMRSKLRQDAPYRKGNESSEITREDNLLLWMNGVLTPPSPVYLFRVTHVLQVFLQGCGEKIGAITPGHIVKIRHIRGIQDRPQRGQTG